MDKYEDKDFYNPERKIEFLNSKFEVMEEKSVDPYARLFKTLKQDEEKYDSDICDFNYDALMDSMSLRFSRGVRSKGIQLSLLKDYVGWCISKRYKKIDDNPIDLIKPSDIDTSVQIRKQFIKDPEQLYNILDTALYSEKEDYQTIDIMYRLLCLLIYEGVSEHEALELTKENVDFLNNTISYNGKVLAMSKKLTSVVKQVYDLDVVYKKIRAGSLAELKLEDSNKLFRCLDYNKNIQVNLKRRLSKIRKDYGNETYEVISLSSVRLYLSGIYYRLYQKELSGKKLDKEDFYFDNEGKADGVGYYKQYFNKLEYEQWKKAFKL